MGNPTEGGSGLFSSGLYLGPVDFAGGNVVHISSGITGLVLAIILGKRRDYTRSAYTPHNIPFVLLGAALLWFGWFGFNAGSALAANGTAVHAVIISRKLHNSTNPCNIPQNCNILQGQIIY